MPVASDTGNRAEPGPSEGIPYLRIAISAGAISLLVLHRIYPTLLPRDTIGIGLLVICALPWLLRIVTQIELPGGWKVTFQEVVKTQERQGRQLQAQSEQIAAQQQLVNNLVKYSMSAS